MGQTKSGSRSRAGTTSSRIFQPATNRRFADGRGYFFTMAGTGDDGQDVCASYWIHPKHSARVVDK
jgi:hypothetical protein